MNIAEISAALARHVDLIRGASDAAPSRAELRGALCLALREQISPSWQGARGRAKDERQVAYISMEFLMGRLLEDALVNLQLREALAPVVAGYGHDLADVLDDEPDAALGNGGLGRLAACFLDSMATLDCPATGYGIRYEHGLFRQSFEAGRQIERPEDWLSYGSPWECRRADLRYAVRFGGEVADGVWSPGETLTAQAWDTPVIGWNGAFVNTLRLWSFEAAEPFRLEQFNYGDHVGAASAGEGARALSRVLYPDDTSEAGKALRLRQEYALSAASLADLCRQARLSGPLAEVLPARTAIQLNDTHPAIAGPELMRILMDEDGLDFDAALGVCGAVFNYTNHTLLPEALERWHVGLMAHLLPRHLEIIERIDARFGGVIAHDQVSMGDLAFVMAHRVNGVSALHTELMKETVFAERHAAQPGKIVNQTNGVTPRRWLMGCNPRLSSLWTEAIGPGWITDAQRLAEIEPHLDDAGFLERVAQAKRDNKAELSDFIRAEAGLAVDPDMMVDVQIKRVHEYKRQHLNILEVVALWQDIHDNPDGDWVPRLRLFGGKAAPGYHFAKDIILLINKVADVLNADPVTRDLLKICYLPNYNVSLAERLIPAADVSQQISTAGKEASGTGNMKFALNGACTIGTLDGANVEIREQVGAENFFLFGMSASEVLERGLQADHGPHAVAADPRLARALEALRDGTFCPEWPDLFAGIADNIAGLDPYFVASDFTDYARASRDLDAVYADATRWNRMAALNAVRSGWFSSDRTIRGYMSDIWEISPVTLTGTGSAAA